MKNTLSRNSQFRVYWLLATGYWLLFPSCALFDNTKLEQQKAEIERLRQETAQLKAETDSLQNQREKEEKERIACRFEQGMGNENQKAGRGGTGGRPAFLLPCEHRFACS